MVPHFKRLSDFILAKRWYMRAVYMPAPSEQRSEQLYRLPIDFAPGFSPFQVPYKDSHKFDIRLTSGTHKP